MSGREGSVEHDFRSALQRIQTAIATPQKIKLVNAALDRRRQVGTLRLSVLAVADEAGHARRLIGHDSCAYADVRREILAAIGARTKGKTQRQIIDELRMKVAELEQQVRARDSRNAELVDRMEGMRLAAKLDLQEVARVAARTGADVPDDDDDDDEDA